MDRFPNKCSACKHFEGLLYPQHGWDSDAQPKCRFRITTSMLIGCGNFYPNGYGCRTDCHYRKEQNCGPDTCSKGEDTLNLSGPCFSYAQKDSSDKVTMSSQHFSCSSIFKLSIAIIILIVIFS